MQEEVKEIYALIDALKTSPGYDFGNYIPGSFKRRIIKIMSSYSITFTDLLEKIRSDAVFREEVAKKMTVNTTDLFRDRDLWLYLREHALPGFAELQTLNIWHTGCSTGLEVYSMMILLEEMELLSKTYILATDLNMDALNIAREGIFNYQFNSNYISNFDNVINNRPDIGITSYSKYFETDPVQSRIIMKDYLRKKPHFCKMDLTRLKPSFKQKFDIIVCRNVLVYFNQELQDKVISLFYQKIKINGCLILGKNETVSGPGKALFVKKEGVYYKA